MVWFVVVAWNVRTTAVSLFHNINNRLAYLFDRFKFANILFLSWVNDFFHVDYRTIIT